MKKWSFLLAFVCMISIISITPDSMKSNMKVAYDDTHGPMSHVVVSYDDSNGPMTVRKV